LVLHRFMSWKDGMTKIRYLNKIDESLEEIREDDPVNLFAIWKDRDGLWHSLGARGNNGEWGHLEALGMVKIMGDDILEHYYDMQVEAMEEEE